MQTFLTSTDFKRSARELDNLRLGKQRVECLQIIKALKDPAYGWQNHPAVKMWRGYDAALARYGLAICEEWVKRGYKDTCYQKIVDLFNGVIPFQEAPAWLTVEFASNHRSILLGKAKEAVKQAAEDLNIQWGPDGHSIIIKDKQYRKFYKVRKVASWYQSFNWTEQPARRNSDNKWPYLWPESEAPDEN